ncbi:SAVED domain-containing protein [Paenibacillus odorifer]|uniref:SMODS-associated and fused to various effectors domain-containing protein n=1 Tax=Paenibacillus odorifer TaxID=189426 RepID=A0A1R0XR23_9BACL|nr:SAVED domain-containing protein [Paenibacillus odorifer]OMD37538.1 hypothetical protein BSK52_21325 [Paenibacillus odorifer]
MLIFLLILIIVIISIAIFFWIKSFKQGRKDEGFATVFITVGLELFVTAFGDFYNKLKEIIILVRDSQSVNDSLRISSEFSQVNYIQLVAGLLLIVFGLFFLRYSKNKLYILNVNGYFTNRIEDSFKTLGLSQFQFKEREVDFINEKKYKMDAQRTVDILELIERKVKSFKEESKGYERGYTGIAHIPFITITGTFLKRTSIHKYFEFDKKETEEFYTLKKGRKYPPLKNNTPYSQIDINATDIILTVSTTTPILDEHLIQFGNMNIIRLSVDLPKDNTIIYWNQLLDYKNKVIEVLNEIGLKFSRVKRIHLLCSTQSCLPFEIGKNVEDYRNIKVISYHFDVQEDKKYPWGIVINGTDKGEFIEG